MRLKKSLILGLPSLFMAATAASAADYGVGVRNPVTQNAVDINNLVGIIAPIAIGITLFVFVLMGYIMFRFREKANPVPSKTTHNTLLEVVWTIVPVLILVVMAVPSIKYLYNIDVVEDTVVRVKATGNTWNWSYEYPDYEDLDSILSIPLEEDEAQAAGKPYLLGTDYPLVVPSGTRVKVEVTSSKNLHGFTVPDFGVKIDAIPGITNEIWFEVFEGKEGTYYGQCAELCGVNHYKMPIEVKVVSKEEFDAWVANGGSFEVAQNENGGTLMAAAQE